MGKSKRRLRKYKKLAAQYGVDIKDLEADEHNYEEWLRKHAPVDVQTQPGVSKPTYTSTTTTLSTFQPCDHKPFPLFRIRKATVYIGARRDLVSMSYEKDTMLRINLLGEQRHEGYQEVWVSPRLRKTELGRFAQMYNDTDTVSVDWPDGGVPNVDMRFWTALYQHIKTVEGKVLLYCIGGHGRTGTAAVILKSLYNQEKRIKNEDVVAWLRQKYCDEVVETNNQIEYLKKMGVQTKEVGGWAATKAWWQGV